MKTRKGKIPISVGVTGGIGSGKTEVCSVFSSLGARVYSADLLAKEFLNTDPAIRTHLTNSFGGDLYDSFGKIKRKQLAKLVFGDDRLLQKLNDIVHPKIILEIRRIIDKEKKIREAPMIMVEAALMYETGSDGMFDYMIVVEAEEVARIERIVRRDGDSRTEIVRRMRAQLPPEAKSKRADFVLRNSGDLNALRSTCEFLFTLLSRMDIPVADEHA